MASLLVASLTSIPLVLLVWDLARHTDKGADRFAGPARQQVG